MKLKHFIGLVAVALCASVSLQSTASAGIDLGIEHDGISIKASDFESSLYSIQTIGPGTEFLVSEFALVDFGPAVATSVALPANYTPVYDAHRAGTFRPPNRGITGGPCLTINTLTRLHRY